MITFSLPFASWGLCGFVCPSIATIGLSDCPKFNRLVKVMSTRSFHYRGTIVPLSLMIGRTIIWDCGIFQQLPFCRNLWWSLPESVIINWWLQNDDFSNSVIPSMTIRWSFSVKFPPLSIFLEYHYMIYKALPPFFFLVLKLSRDWQVESLQAGSPSVIEHFLDFW